MNPIKPEPRASLLAELLLYRAVLGRGFISPFPATKGLVFTSALPQDAIFALAGAEAKFAKWHHEQIEPDRRRLAELEASSGGALDAVTGNKAAITKLRDRLNKRPNVTWKERQVSDSTIVELLKTHYYGAITYFDAVGARLAASLSHTTRLAGDMGWVTYTEGTTDEALIRANGSGGANIHSLAGLNPIFHYFCSCKEQHIDKLREKIRDTPGGQVGMGHSIIVAGRPGIFSGTTAETLYSLLSRVYALGETTEDDKKHRRVHVDLVGKGWKEFLNWNLPDIIGEKEPAAWQWKLAETSATSPRNAVLFGAQAAMVGAFIEAAVRSPHGELKLVELHETHLDLAKQFTRVIYKGASGSAGFESRISHLKSGATNWITPQRLAVAKVAIEEAIRDSDLQRVSRNQVRREIKGATLGLLDELVKNGDIVELSGTAECQMGKVVKAYCMPIDAPRCEPQNARDEYEEAVEEFAESPESFPESQAIEAAARIRQRAEIVFNDHFFPAVPTSRMTRTERRLLPKVLEMFPDSFLLRGPGTNIPDPEAFAADEDSPLDREAPNLWVRCRPNGKDFCDWNKSQSLELAEHWGSGEEDAPQVVPA